MSSRQKRWAYGYFLVLLALALGISGLPSPLYPLYQEQWQLSPLTITVVFAAYAIGALVSALTVGPISDAVGRKPVLLVALTIVLVGLGVFLIADHPWQLVLARLLHGVAVGALTVVAGAALLDLRPHDGARNGMAGGVALNTGMAVTVLGVALAAQWAKDPLRLPYVIFAVITAAILAILMLLSEPHVERTGGRLRIAAPTVPRGIRTDFWFAAMGIVTAWSVLGVFMSLYPRLTQEATGHPSIVFVGVMISVMAAASALAQWASGRGDPRTTAIIGDLGMAVSLLVAIWALHSGLTWFVIVDSIVLGIAFGMAFGGSLRYLSEVVPGDARGSVMSAYYLLGYLAMAVPAVAAGAMSSRFGTLTVFPYFVGAVTLGCLAAAWLGLRGAQEPPVVVTDVAP